MKNICLFCKKEFYVNRRAKFCSKICSHKSHSNWMKENGEWVINTGKIVLSDFDSGWISGIIDGEGSLSIFKSLQKTSINQRYRTSIYVSNNNLNLLKKIQKLCNGNGAITATKLQPRRKQSYVYKIPTLAQQQILPYLNLIVKKRHKEIFFEMWTLLINKGGANSRSKDTNEKLEKLKMEINSLNKRGRQDV